MLLKKAPVRLVVFVSLLTALSAVVTAAATTYYVSQSTGNDGNNGTTSSTPWQTLTKVGSGTYGAGDSILLKSGDIWNGMLAISNCSGASGSPITLSSYGSGNNPIIERGTIDTELCVLITNASYWNISNLEIANAAEGIVMKYTTAGHSGITITNCSFQEIYGIQYPGSAIKGVNYTFSSGICFAGSFNNAIGPLVSGITVENCSTSNGCAELFLVSVEDSITGYCVKNVTLKDCNCQGGVFGYWLHCVDSGSATGMIATYNGVQSFANGPCATGIERSRNFTFDSCVFGYCERQGTNPDGCGFDFEGRNTNCTVENSTIKYNAGVGLMFYIKYGGNTGCVVNNCQFIQDGANPNAPKGYEVYFDNTDSSNLGGKVTNNEYSLRTGVAFINTNTSCTISNNNPIPLPPAAPALSSPANGSTNQPCSLTLSWGTVSGANSYAMQLSTGSTFSSNTFYTNIAAQSGQSSGTTSLIGLLAGTKYYWEISATNTGGTGPWSGVWDFATTAVSILADGKALLKTDFAVNGDALVYLLASSGAVEITFSDLLGRSALVLNYYAIGWPPCNRT